MPGGLLRTSGRHTGNDTSDFPHFVQSFLIRAGGRSQMLDQGFLEGPSYRDDHVGGGSDILDTMLPTEFRQGRRRVITLQGEEYSLREETPVQTLAVLVTFNLNIHEGLFEYPGDSGVVQQLTRSGGRTAVG